MINITHITIAQFVTMAFSKVFHPLLSHKMAYDFPNKVLNRLNGWM